jgi:MGT family glycosyltransferase
MPKLLCYTSPARGHLYPTMPVLLELQRRGWEIHVCTLAKEVDGLRALGLHAEPIAASIEAIEHDDWRARSPIGGLERAVAVFVARAEHEAPDLQHAIRRVAPDVVLVDFNCWGAATVAEASGIPWALFMPYFLPWALPGIPPFGPGLAPRTDWLGRVRDTLIGAVIHRVINRALPQLVAIRAKAGLPAIEHMTMQGRSAPLILYYTAEPFEYPCPERPKNARMVGPLFWEPPAATPPWLAEIDRPLVVVTCSTEFQDDGRLVACALEALADEDVFVVATTAGTEPPAAPIPRNARVERFVAHSVLLPRATAVVCHGGMGITQKALASGVPACVVPFGRDQHEVARHVEVAGAGVRLPSKSLSVARLRDAVHRTRACAPGARRIAAAFRDAGGAAAAADAMEELLPAVAPILLASTR